MVTLIEFKCIGYATSTYMTYSFMHVRSPIKIFSCLSYMYFCCCLLFSQIVLHFLEFILFSVYVGGVEVCSL